eukprot:7758399-Prorocentrum_lima.AAC.1
MTSSLVGSEMCIRDRLQPPASTVSFTQTSAICAARYDMAHRTLQDSTACLLYTSDAADDM